MKHSVCKSAGAALPPPTKTVTEYIYLVFIYNISFERILFLIASSWITGWLILHGSVTHTRRGQRTLSLLNFNIIFVYALESMIVMLKLNRSFDNNYKSNAAGGVSNCLKQIKFQNSLYTCALYSKLPFNINEWRFWIKKTSVIDFFSWSDLKFWQNICFIRKFNILNFD